MTEQENETDGQTQNESTKRQHQSRYSAALFIAAIPGTGGVISMIADKVGCNWHTAKKYIEQHPTVKEAWQAERLKIGDRAQHNVIRAIVGGDLPLSKWWLQVMDPDFREKKDVNLTGPGVKAYVLVSPDDWPDDNE